VTDFILFVLLGLVQIVTAVWGGIVSVKSLPETENRKLHLWAFIVLGVFGFLLILATGVQTYQNQKAGEKKQDTLSGDLQDARSKLDRSLLAQAEMNGQLKSIELVMGKFGTSGWPGMKELASALSLARSQNAQVLQSQKESNKDLCHYAVTEAQKIRELQSQYERTEHSIRDKYFDQLSHTVNQDEKNKIYAQEQQETIQLFFGHELRFKNEFVGTAKYLRDSILDRLPADKRAGMLVNNNQAESNLNSGELIGAFSEYGIATYLDVLSKALCAESH
jgi:hypothetical protein